MQATDFEVSAYKQATLVGVPPNKIVIRHT